MRITKNQVICGIPAFNLQRTFILLHNEGPQAIFPPAIFNDSDLMANLIHDGYMEEKGLGVALTCKGRAFAMASTKDPISRKDADEVLNLFLNSIKEYNARRKHRIGAAFLFGSYLSDQPFVNDVDIGIEIIPKGYSKRDWMKIPDQDMGLYVSATEFFRKVSDRLSIHHYRELPNLKVATKRIYFDDSEDSKSYEAAKILRCMMLGHKMSHIT